MTYNPINQRAYYNEQIKIQDNNLDKLEKGLDNLHSYAKTINRETKSQNQMLDGLGNDMDKSNDQMNITNHKLGKLLKTLDKNGCCNQYVWIGILSLILIMLVILIICL